MKYLGGKHKLATDIVQYIAYAAKPGSVVWDAFCGGLSVSEALSEAGFSVIATDINPALISLYQAVKDGWDPPEELSESSYREAKKLPDCDPLKAFAGFGCSFGGKWFGGYARNNDKHNYAASTRSSLLRIRSTDIRFSVHNFLKDDPHMCDVAYLDPPYRGTTEYSGTDKFDSAAFDVAATRLSRNCHVFVSEYHCPVGDVIFEKTQDITVALDKSKKTRLEKLFYIRTESRPVRFGLF